MENIWNFQYHFHGNENPYHKEIIRVSLETKQLLTKKQKEKKTACLGAFQCIFIFFIFKIRNIKAGNKFV